MNEIGNITSEKQSDMEDTFVQEPGKAHNKNVVPLDEVIFSYSPKGYKTFDKTEDDTVKEFDGDKQNHDKYVEKVSVHTQKKLQRSGLDNDISTKIANLYAEVRQLRVTDFWSSSEYIHVMNMMIRLINFVCSGEAVRIEELLLYLEQACDKYLKKRGKKKKSGEYEDYSHENGKELKKWQKKVNLMLKIKNEICHGDRRTKLIKHYGEKLISMQSEFLKKDEVNYKEKNCGSAEKGVVGAGNMSTVFSVTLPEGRIMYFKSDKFKNGGDAKASNEKNIVSASIDGLFFCGDVIAKSYKAKIVLKGNEIHGILMENVEGPTISNICNTPKLKITKRALAKLCELHVQDLITLQVDRNSNNIICKEEKGVVTDIKGIDNDDCLYSDSEEKDLEANKDYEKAEYNPNEIFSHKKSKGTLDMLLPIITNHDFRYSLNANLAPTKEEEKKSLSYYYDVERWQIPLLRKSFYHKFLKTNVNDVAKRLKDNSPLLQKDKNRFNRFKSRLQNMQQILKENLSKIELIDDKDETVVTVDTKLIKKGDKDQKYLRGYLFRYSSPSK